MNKIEFPRKDIFNNTITQSKLENWYVTELKLTQKIQYRLQKITWKTSFEKSIISTIISCLNYLLLAKPDELMKLTRLVGLKKYQNIFSKKTDGRISSTDFGIKILDAFNYNYYRGTILVELAKKLNVKCCPYCNMSYTLIARDEKEDKTLTKFQFDHFYSKTKYPMLSMSLYNLIPSCAVCNHRKSTDNLDISFNPYHSSISESFVFKVNNPIQLYIGKKQGDFLKIDAEPKSSSPQEAQKFEAYKNTFNIEALYQRHGDVAQEIYDKAYLYPYISNNNFSMLPKYSKNYRLRLWMGTYTEKEEIENRPLTKLKQDLWEQATEFFNKKRTDEY